MRLEALEDAKLNWWYLKCYPRFADDKEVVLEAVKNEGRALELASDALRSDREIVLAAVATDGWTSALQYASDAVRADRDIVLAALATHGDALQYASDALRADRDIVLAAVAKDGDALQYASDALRADREIVLAVVAEGGDALKYASDALRADREIIMAAIQRNAPGALKYAADELQRDFDIVAAAVEKDGFALHSARDEWKKDLSIVLRALRHNRDDGLWDIVDGSLRNHPHVVAAAMGCDCYYYQGLRSWGTQKITAQVVWTLEALLQRGYDGGQMDQILRDETFGRTFQRKTMETIFLLPHFCPVDTPVARTIMDYVGLPEEVKLAKEILRLAPVLTAMANSSMFTNFDEWMNMLGITVPNNRS